MPEQGSPAGAERLGKEYSAVRCLGWVEAVEEGMERAVRGGSATMSTTVFGAAHEQWSNGGGRKRGAPRWGAPFIATRGSGTKVARRRSLGWQNGGGSRSLDVVGMVWAPMSGQWGWRVGPTRFHIFPNYPNWLKFTKSKRLPYLATKNPNFCMGLVWNILNNILNCVNFKFQTKTKLKNPETDSIFESLMNFKRDSTILEKADKFFKIPSWLDLYKS
jgi:hypothetical protein